MGDAIRVIDRVSDMADWQAASFLDGYVPVWDASTGKFVGANVGSQGAQGFQGAAGAGSQGFQGFQGAAGTGAQGSTGSAGSQGFQGVAGTSGAQGSQGNQGVAGSAGGGTLTGAYSALPAAGTTGRVFIPTDAPWISSLYDTGSQWVPYWGGFALVSPPSSGWAWLNQGPATLTAEKASLLIENGDTGTVFLGTRARLRSLPAAPCVVTMGFVTTVYGGSFTIAMYRESASGKNHRLNFYMSGGPGMNVQNNDNTDNFIGAYVTSLLAIPPVFFVRYTDDGANKTWQLSFDGVRYQYVYMVTRTDHCTPDQVGFGSAMDNGAIRLIHYTEG